MADWVLEIHATCLATTYSLFSIVKEWLCQFFCLFCWVFSLLLLLLLSLSHDFRGPEYFWLYLNPEYIITYKIHSKTLMYCCSQTLSYYLKIDSNSSLLNLNFWKIANNKWKLKEKYSHWVFLPWTCRCYPNCHVYFSLALVLDQASLPQRSLLHLNFFLIITLLSASTFSPLPSLWRLWIYCVSIR